MKKIINLTPHDVNIYEGNVLLLTIKASNIVARVDVTTNILAENINDTIPVSKSCFGKIKGLPNPEEDTIYIVSRMIAERAKDRDDLYITNGSVRDENGHIIGCTSLTQI